MHRRGFSAGLIGSLAAFGLIEGLWARDLWAATIKPTIGLWLRELVAMTRDLRGQRMTDLEFQGHLDALLRRVDLEALVKLIKLDEVEGRLAAGGSTTEEAGLAVLDGMPAGVGFNRRIFACRRGRSIVPHGHTNMCSGFLVLRGAWRGRHWDRVETHADHCVIAPTIDRGFVAGEGSTISDHRDNVHWFQAESEAAFLFNVHVAGYDPTIVERPGRMYIDPDGERRADGTIAARRISGAAARAKYG